MARTSRYQTVDKSKKYNVALYIRLSEEDKRNVESESVKSQKNLLTQFVNNLENVSSFQFFVDDGYVGGNFNRPAFKTMLGDIFNKKINCVIVKDLSRFGRNYVEVGNYIQSIFPLYNIRFISINDGLDTFTNPEKADVLLMGLSDIMNEEYLKDCSIKAKISYSSRQKKGQFTAPFAPYGYKRSLVEKNKLEIDNEVAPIIKHIYNLFIEKKSYVGVAKQLSIENILTPSEYKQSLKPDYYSNRLSTLKHIWSSDTVKTILTSEFYIGNTCQNRRNKINYKEKKWVKLPRDKWIIIENTHKPIIDKDLFYQVQEIIKSRDVSNYFQKTTSSKKNDNYFSGLLYCGHCGNKLTYTDDKYLDYSFYKCKLKRMSLCDSPLIRTDKLSEIVLKIIQQYVKIACDFERTIKEIDKYKKRVLSNAKNLSQQTIENRLKNIDNEKDRLYQLYRETKISLNEYQTRKKELEKNYKTLQLQSLQEKEIQNPTENKFISNFVKYKNIKKLNREIVKTLIKKIKIYGYNNIEITFNFRDEFEEVQKYITDNGVYK